MAGDWIKMRVDIGRDPKVIAMATFLAGERAVMNFFTDPVSRTCKESLFEHLSCSHLVNIVVSKLLLTWGAASERGKPDGDDLVLPNASLYTLDTIADLPQFGKAMAFAGWVREERMAGEKTRLRFLSYLIDNTCVEDRRRAKNAEYQRASRERRRADSQQNVSAASAPREELEKSKKNKDPPTPRSKKAVAARDPPSDDGFAAFWAAYPRKEAKQKALKAWGTLRPTPELLARILTALERAKQGRQWREGVIPHPATWLNDRRWTDELDPTGGKNGRGEHGEGVGSNPSRVHCAPGKYDNLPFFTAAANGVAPQPPADPAAPAGRPAGGGEGADRPAGGNPASGPG